MYHIWILGTTILRWVNKYYVALPAECAIYNLWPALQYKDKKVFIHINYDISVYI